MSTLERITSRTNAKILNAKKVRDGGDDSYIFVEGKRLVREALRARIEISTAFISDDLRDDELVSDLTEQCESVYTVSEKVSSSLEDTKSGQGVFVIAGRPDFAFDVQGSEIPVVVLLDKVNNPSNLGAVVRAAEAAGSAGVMTTTLSASAFSPKALRSSMGSAFRLPIWQGVEFMKAVEWSRANGLRICATAGSRKQSYVDLDWKTPRLLLLGSEAHGLSSEVLDQSDEIISIPMSDQVESLNLAVAAGVILFEARRQNAL